MFLFLACRGLVLVAPMFPLPLAQSTAAYKLQCLHCAADYMCRMYSVACIPYHALPCHACEQSSLSLDRYSLAWPARLCETWRWGIRYSPATASLAVLPGPWYLRRPPVAARRTCQVEVHAVNALCMEEERGWAFSGSSADAGIVSSVYLHATE
ncbi:hypothetical protein V8C42DRAFT_327465 [Trichoderma barbatum]